MVSLLRNGPRMLLVGTADYGALKPWLTECLGAEQMPMGQVFDSSDEFHTILYIVPQLKPHVGVEEVLEVLLVRQEAVMVLCSLSEAVSQGLISGLRPAPQTLILRVLGDMEQTLSKLQQDFGGTTADYMTCVEQGRGSTTIIGLTDKPVNRAATLRDLHPEFLSVEGDYAALRRQLALKAFGYLQSGDQTKVWRRLEVRIYDLYSAYQLHYQRLLEVLDALEIGFVLGEFWSKDYPRFMMPVEVYSVVFFTYQPPIEVKRVLLGLEHLDSGVRLVDYDLFENNKKVYWKETQQQRRGQVPLRQEAAVAAREALRARLEPEAWGRILALETRLEALRSSQ